MTTTSVIEQLRGRLQQALQPTELTIDDESAAHLGHAGAREGGHYQLQIVAQAFAGKSTIARHRLIYDAAGDLMRGKIHALSIHAKVPGEV